MKRSTASFVLFVLLLAIPSCSARYGIAVAADGSAEVDLSAAVGIRTATLIANLAGVQAGTSVPLVDASAIARSLKDAPGVRTVALRNTDARSLSGTVSIERFDRFLSSRFVRVEKTETGGGKFGLSLDREAAEEILSTLSPDISDYLSALMAPVATGEKLTAAEYGELLSSVYGSGIAEEIRDARIKLALSLPGSAVLVRGGTAKGRTAEFSLPLIDFLTLEHPISLEASWK